MARLPLQNVTSGVITVPHVFHILFFFPFGFFLPPDLRDEINCRMNVALGLVRLAFDGGRR